LLLTQAARRFYSALLSPVTVPDSDHIAPALAG
jgi:hypothetical protein